MEIKQLQKHHNTLKLSQQSNFDKHSYKNKKKETVNKTNISDKLDKTLITT